MRLQNSFLILSYHKYMSKKTVKRHYKKHRISNKKKRTYRKGNKNKRTYKKKRTYRKKRCKRIDKGTVKGVKLFTEPKKMHFQSISVTPIQSGNMIPGLRNM